MKTILLFLLVFIFCVNVFSQSYSFEEDKWRRKLENIDKTIYTSESCVLQRHILSTQLRYAFILVSRDIHGTRVSFYLDSLKCFYRNGQLKLIQANDSIGTPTFTRNYNRYGELKSDCKYNYTGNIPYKPTKKASKEALGCYTKRYRNGILISEGLNVGGKKENLHITYDKNGNEKSRMVYSKGKAIK